MLTERRVIKQVAIIPQQSAANVQWANQIVRIANGEEEVVSEVYERKAYGQPQKDEFIAEVEGAEGYISVLGW